MQDWTMGMGRARAAERLESPEVLHRLEIQLSQLLFRGPGGLGGPSSEGGAPDLGGAEGAEGRL